MPIYRYVCESGHECERRAGYEADAWPCPACGKPAARQSVYATSFVMAGQTFVPFDQRRVKLSKFMEAASELEYKHTKAENEVGHKLDNPSYFKEGIKRAKEVMAGRRAPPKEF